MRSRSTSGASGTERVWIFRISDAALAVGRLHRDAAVEASRTQQRRVQDLGAVRGPRTITFVLGLEAVHLGQDLIERLLALVVTAADPAHVARARAPDRIELVDEDDRRRRLLGLLEEVAHARGADAHDRLDELRCRHGEEGGVRFARDGAGQQRLSGPRRPVEQHAARDSRAELRVALRVLEEVNDLDELVFGLVDPGHVIEADSVLLAGPDTPRGRAAEAAEHAAASAALIRRKIQMKNATSRIVGRKPSRSVTQSDRPVSGGSALTTTFWLLEQLRDLRRIDEGRHLGLELRDLHGLGLAGRVVGRFPLQLALDRVLPRADLADVAGRRPGRRRTAGRAPARAPPGPG